MRKDIKDLFLKLLVVLFTYMYSYRINIFIWSYDFVLHNILQVKK